MCSNLDDVLLFCQTAKSKDPPTVTNASRINLCVAFSFNAAKVYAMFWRRNGHVSFGSFFTSWSSAAAGRSWFLRGLIC